MTRYNQFLQQQSEKSLVFFHSALVLFIGLIDYLSGGEISFSIFYLWPVAQLTWFCGRKMGYGLAVWAAIVWLAADLLTGRSYSAVWIPLWNALVRLAFFLTVSYLLAKWRAAEKRRLALMQFIVHDLRSPLATTMMGLDLLREYRADVLDEHQQSLIVNSLAATSRGLWLVNALLDIPRLESGHMLLDLTDIPVAVVLESSLAQVQLLVQQRKVTIAVAGDTAVIVHADAELLHRLLVNLLTNALKYTPDDSTICVTVSLQEAERLVYFSVADQGPGVPPEWLEKVFDMFVQVDARKTGKSMGSGVGLAFCRLAMEAQGGRIWMENQPTGGAKVSFTLPAQAWSNEGGLVGSKKRGLQKVV